MIAALIFTACLATAYHLWSRLQNVSPEFHFILIIKDNHPLKLLNGETLQLHPKDRLKIKKISTNILFNRDVRILAKGLDVNAFLYEEIPLWDLLPDKNIYRRYDFRLIVKHYNQEIGHINIIVEPFIEDWLEKADRTIDREKRITILKQALKWSPGDIRIKDRLAREYISLKRWEEAASILEEMVQKNPDSARLYDLLRAYEAMSRVDDVISVLRRLIKIHPDATDLRLRLAATLASQQRYSEATKEYEILLNQAKGEDLLRVYMELGFLYTKTNHIEQAIAVYLSALEMDKEDAGLYYNLSLLYEKNDQKDKADLFLSKALKLDRGDMEGRLKLAGNLIEKDKLEEAEQYLSEVIKKRPESMKALSLMALILEKRGDKKKLKEVYGKMLSIDPQNKTVTYNLGVIEYELGNLSASLPYLKKYLETSPKDPEARALLFDIYKRQKKDDLALKEALALIELKPDETVYYHQAFEILNDRGRYEDIIQLMKKGVQSHSNDIDMRKYLIFAYLKTGKDDLAIEQIEEVIKLNPDNIPMLLQLARLDEKQGRLREALSAYKKILDISPGHEEAEEAYIRLRLEVLPRE